MLWHHSESTFLASVDLQQQQQHLGFKFQLTDIPLLQTSIFCEFQLIAQ
jgi:hypothetical protein